MINIIYSDEKLMKTVKVQFIQRVFISHVK